MPGHAGLVGEARFGLQLGPADDVEEGVPVRRRIGRGAEVAVQRLERPPREDARVAGAADRRPEALAVQVRRHRELHHALEHRHLDHLALAAAFAVQQRGQQGIGGHQADTLVGDPARRILRPALRCGLRSQRGHAAAGLDQVVERGAFRIGPILAEADQGAIDELGVDAGQHLVAQAQAFHGLRAHVAHHRVGAAHHLQQRVAACGVLQVEHDAALAAVELQKQRRHAGVAARRVVARQVALRRLDLDHVGTQVTQGLGGVGAHRDAGQVEDANARERACSGEPGFGGPRRVDPR
jgi:hypothetical protein